MNAASNESTDPAAGPTPDMTIDQVAQFAGVPASTVRMYQNKGLLPAPERRGRVGYYSEEHRQRLTLIASLQDRGFSLAAIKESLDAWEVGRTLDHHLGITQVAPSLTRQPLRLAVSELMERFAGVEFSQDDLLRAQSVGLLELDATEVIIPVPVFADIGPAVAQLGIPLGEILDEYEALQVSVTEIAERFQAVFERHVWAEFDAAASGPEAIASLTADASRLSSLATAVVTTELHARFAEFANHYLTQALEQGKPEQTA